MPGVVRSPESVVRAHCEDCGWEFERSLEAGDERVDAKDNQEIAARVVRNHAFTCASDAPEPSWGETADVTMDISGGEA